jgi:hypothetical protein
VGAVARLRRPRLGGEARPQAVSDGDSPGGLAQQDVIVRGAKRRRGPDWYLLLTVAKLRVVMLDL